MDQPIIKIPEPKEEIGPVADQPMTKRGRVIFISRSVPFMQDGVKMCYTKRAISNKRQLKKKIMQEKGFKNGNQFLQWVKEQRKIEPKAA